MIELDRQINNQSSFEQEPDFGMELDFGDTGFDINSAFQEAVQGIASDEELALDEKIRRMENIVFEGSSEIYRDFIDFRQMAEQMQMICNHDHSFNESMQQSSTLSSFLDQYKDQDQQSEGSRFSFLDSRSGDEDKQESRSLFTSKKDKKKKKKKKPTSWLDLFE